MKRILVPAALPNYVTGLRAGLALGWMFVIAAELMGASKGLGFLMLDGQMTGRPATIMAALILFAIAGKVSDALLVAAGRRVLSWQDDFASTQVKTGHDAADFRVDQALRRRRGAATLCARPHRSRGRRARGGGPGGTSGCGKTTLLRIVSGLERATDGWLTLRGDPVTGPRRDVGVVFQEPRLMPWFTVRENVRLALLDLRAQAQDAIIATFCKTWDLSISPRRFLVSCPAAWRSASPSRALLRASRRSCCSTSRSAPLTASRGLNCRIIWAPYGKTPVSRCCWSHTISTKP